MPRPGRRAALVARRLALLVLAMGLGAWLCHRAVLWWIDYSDEPALADLLVVLSGSYTRAPYAAELWKRGLAPEVWISSPKRTRQERVLLGLGIPSPPEDWFEREILRRKGVPASRVRLYAREMDGTRYEAEALARALAPGQRRVLLVTSRFHARRTALVFRHALPGREVRVCASPYDGFDRRWWRDKQLAESVLLELFKVAFYLVDGRLGPGRFHPPPT